MWSLRVLAVPAWVSSRCSGFRAQSKDTLVKLTCFSKVAVGIRVGVWGYPVMDWQPVQGVTHALPCGSFNALYNPPPTTHCKPELIK